MATKRKNYKSTKRKPFWENALERFIGFFRKLLMPALVIWLIAWLWLGGIFAKTGEAMWDGFVGWTAEQGLRVTDVVIEGRHRVNIMDLKKAVGVEPNDPLLGVDIDDIQGNIQKLAWVGDAVVRRSYNGIVTIDLRERIPFVMWDRPGRGQVVVDRAGEIIHAAKIKDFKNLLIVRGVDAPNHAANLMVMVKAEPDLIPHIKGAEWIGARRWDLMTVRGTRIHLPEDDMGYALSRLAKSVREKDILSKPLKSLDLRAGDRIIIEK